MKNSFIYVVCMTLATILVCSSAVEAKTRKIAVFELGNQALLGKSEVGFLDDLVRSVFEELSIKHYRVFMRS